MTASRPWIVITTINQPTEAIRAFAELVRQRDWRMVVVGDTATPPDWNCDGVVFLSLEQQHARFSRLSELIPTRHYSRKNLGYLYAIQEGATCIIDTDDDNIPYQTFGGDMQPSVQGRVLGGSRWINVYAEYTDLLAWPRGLPLDAIHCRGVSDARKQVARCSVQQYLADEDPDVDAIWRLLFKQPLTFRSDTRTVIIDEGCYVPFNSQNTVFFKDAFSLLYLPCFVSFRMTDIWRSLVAQRVLWANGGRLCFHEATVRQVRNKHDLMKDFRDEIDGYLRNREIAECLGSLPLMNSGAPADHATACWEALERIGVLRKDELNLIDHWLRQCN